MTIMAAVSRRLFSFLCCLLFIMISRGNAQPSFLKYFCVNDEDNYTAYRTYHTNLNTLLSNLTSNTEIDYGFYNFSYGENTDRVNTIGLCKGDVKPDYCRRCLNDSRFLLPKLCPNQKEAIGWYDDCMLRYSNRSIFGIMEDTPSHHLENSTNATEVDQFTQVLRNLMDSLIRTAESGDSRLKYGAAHVTGPNSQHIYGLVQCTPDLNGPACRDCLGGAFNDLRFYSNGKIGGRVMRTSCNIRYENYGFFEPAAADVPPPPSPSTNKNNTSPQGKSNTSQTAIAISVPVVVVVLVVTFICIYLIVRKPRKNFQVGEEADDDEVKIAESLQFNFDTIRIATNDFSDSNKLGQGGFGAVYKGKLSNGQEIAVKRLSTNSGQGDIEFKNEVLLVAKLQHRNLVSLLGFCQEERERLLVYEFLPNKSLDYFIFDPIKRLNLDWERRYKIIEGIARGLLYLHQDSQLHIIHRDIKASNILLDEEMKPKISDFGMAKSFVTNQTPDITKVVGTYGYMAPEYALHRHFSVKTDVFSFGVLVLEVVSGHKNSVIHNGDCVEHLINFAWRNWREGTASNIVDPKLNNNSRNEIMRCIHIGLLCVQERAAERPTMASVVVMLNRNSSNLPSPSKPAYCMNDQDISDVRPSERNKSLLASVNETSITELTPR